MHSFSKLAGVALILALWLPAKASADFIVSFGPALFMERSGIHSLDVYLRSPNNLSPNSFQITFELPSGSSWTQPPGTATGPGMYGHGNTLFPAQFAVSDQRASLGLFLNDYVPVPTTNVLLASLSFDVGSLAPGAYDLSFTAPSAFTAGGPASGPAGFGTFEVTAVPEPTSFALVGLAGVGALVWHRRQIKNRATTRATTS